MGALGKGGGVVRRESQPGDYCGAGDPGRVGALTPPVMLPTSVMMPTLVMMSTLVIEKPHCYVQAATRGKRRPLKPRRLVKV